MPVVSEVPSRAPAGESLVVLTRDAALTQTLKVLGSGHNIVTVDAEADLAGHLVGGQIGVAIIDTAAATSPVAELSKRLKAQFPDLVLIVAGRLDHQHALAAQITNGTIYRFLATPISEQRVKLFVDAAWRRHDAGHATVSDFMTATGVLPVQRTAAPRNAVIGGGILLAVLVVVGGWFITRKPTPAPVPTTEASGQSIAAAPARDVEFENLLSRADRALDAGALVTPEGANAADLYRQALHRNPNDPRAAAGIEKVIDKLLTAAEAQLAARHLDEAQALTDEARSVKPDHVRVAFLTAQIAKERERVVLTKARQAASTGNIEQAITVLDNAARQGDRSTLVAEARQEMEQKQLGSRAGDFLEKAADRMRSGQIVEPSQDNARFFIESARAVAPNDPEVRQAERQLNERLETEARRAMATGDTARAQQWIAAAADSGVSREDIASLTREEQQVQTNNKAESMARLVQLFNQRLAQGQVIDPPSDSAKYYLTQLTQADARHPSTITARQALAARALDEAKEAARRQDFAGANRWLAEAHTAGADDASIAAVQHDMTTPQVVTPRVPEIVSATKLEQTHNSPPVYPITARANAQSGWVDLEFLVKADGSVTNVITTGAEPVGVFEEAAVAAVRKWRYKPAERDGHPVDQRARLRMRFTLDK
jgi:TonB family protein